VGLQTGPIEVRDTGSSWAIIPPRTFPIFLLFPAERRRPTVLLLPPGPRPPQYAVACPRPQDAAPRSVSRRLAPALRPPHFSGELSAATGLSSRSLTLAAFIRELCWLWPWGKRRHKAVRFCRHGPLASTVWVEV
jgi:hypothetical protein